MVPVSSIGGNVHRRRRLTLELIFLEVGPGKSGAWKEGACREVGAILLPRCKSLIYIVLAGNVAMLRKVRRNDL
jgi:hypothetical protein